MEPTALNLKKSESNSEAKNKTADGQPPKFIVVYTIGLFIGTYSSVYTAAPILIWLGVTSNSFVPQETEADKQEKIARGEA